MNKKKLNHIISFVGIAFGILSIIFGIVVLCSSAYGFADTVRSYITYGADYYTDSYEAMAATANNIAVLVRVVRVGVEAAGYLLLIFGLTIIVYFAKSLLKTQSNKTINVIAGANNENKFSNTPINNVHAKSVPQSVSTPNNPNINSSNINKSNNTAPIINTYNKNVQTNGMSAINTSVENIDIDDTAF